jgi:hypothetical protein
MITRLEECKRRGLAFLVLISRPRELAYSAFGVGLITCTLSTYIRAYHLLV